MSSAPDQPKIYHITHQANLSQIVKQGAVCSDAECRRREIEYLNAGMSEIKQRRLRQLEVKCHPGTRVGQYVPFYFCPRSIMLYILHCGNHPGVFFRGGQRQIIHLQADLHTAVHWADQHRIRWAFSDANAGARYARFFRSLEALHELHWNAIAADDFRDPTVKEGKQAEFLFFQAFPWSLIEHIGVADRMMLEEVQRIIDNAAHQPSVSVEDTWYF